MTINQKGTQEITINVSEFLLKRTTITLDNSVKDLLDKLKIIKQESYNAEILRLIKELLESRQLEVPA